MTKRAEKVHVPVTLISYTSELETCDFADQNLVQSCEKYSSSIFHKTVPDQLSTAGTQEANIDRHKGGTILKRLFAIMGPCCIIVVLLAACGSAPSGPNPVHMSATNFVQSSITIKKGESITLMNDSPFVGHTIANGTWENGTAKPAIEAGAPEVKDVQIGGSSSATIGPFTTAGTFHLYCTVHAGMNLTVIVQ